MRSLIVGEDYPGEVPITGQEGGGLFEVMTDASMQLMIQLPGIKPAELAAFQAGLKSYALYVSPEPPFVAVWIWKYAAPVGFTETPFHIGVYKDDRIERFQRDLPHENNALTTVVVDGKKIVHLNMSGLMHSAMGSFHAAIRVQQYQHSSITLTQYKMALDRVYRMNSRELYERGTRWLHRLPLRAGGGDK